VPFAGALAELIPPKAVRLRRDLGQLSRAIKAHALLHRDHRGRSKKGAIVATIDEDYAAVRALMADLLATAAEVKTRKAVQETVEVVRELEFESDSRDGVSTRARAEELQLEWSQSFSQVGKSSACPGCTSSTATYRPGRRRRSSRLVIKPAFSAA
jgi:hypothetical protein